MRFGRAAALAATVTTATSSAVGFNYGSTLASGAGKTQADFQNEFSVAQNLVGGPGANSARLYTMVQGGTAYDPISAIPAAMATNTRLLLGLWGSAGQDAFNNELAALTAAIKQYGSAFADLVDGISVGSEDLYRTSVIGIANKAGVGATPDTLVTYIGEVRNVIAGTILADKMVGHVDTWNSFTNGSNSAVINAVDFLGVDAYPYFETTTANSIENGHTSFFSALDQVYNVAAGKKVMVTETGWPVAGPVSGQAVASVANAKSYWDSVGCALFGSVDTYWYTLYDGNPSPSFGIVGSTLSTTPLFDLTCPAAASSSVVASTSAATSTQQQNQAVSTTLATVVKPTTTAAAPTTSVAAVTTAAAATTTAAAGTTAVVPVSQISDGQVQAGTTAVAVGTTAVVPVSQISDGQVQAGTTAVVVSTTAAVPVSQISDGQVQAGTQTQAQAVTTTAAVGTTAVVPVSQISDGQVQAGTQTQVATTLISTSTSAPAQPSVKSCPAALTGTWEFPHLIVPVDKDQPSAAAGTSYFGTFNESVSTTFNFDLPASYAGMTCSLVFLFPTQDQLTTSSFTFAGQGGLDVYELSSPVTESTSYSNVPSGVKLASIPDVKPGNSYVVASHECAAGQRVSFEFEATGSLALNYFQDYNPSPIGAYITVC